jgi:hypothetical protein
MTKNVFAIIGGILFLGFCLFLGAGGICFFLFVLGTWLIAYIREKK